MTPCTTFVVSLDAINVYADWVRGLGRVACVEWTDPVRWIAGGTIREVATGDATTLYPYPEEDQPEGTRP